MARSSVLAAAVCAALLASSVNAAADSSPDALGQIIDQAVVRVPACVGLAVAPPRDLD